MNSVPSSSSLNCRHSQHVHYDCREVIAFVRIHLTLASLIIEALYDLIRKYEFRKNQFYIAKISTKAFNYTKIAQNIPISHKLIREKIAKNAVAINGLAFGHTIT